MVDRTSRLPAVVAPLRPRITPPVLASTVLERHRLFDLLDRKRPGAVTFVVAPSGFGKSALMASWLNGRGGFQAWLSLDRVDDNPVDLARAVVAASQRAIPGIGRAVLAMVTSAPDAPPAAIGAALAGELASLVDPFVLVLDDAHELAGDRAWELIAGMVAGLAHSAHVHVVMTSRTSPRLDGPSLRLAGRLVEIGASDLAFRPDEVVAVAQRVGQPVEPEQLDQIVGLSAGWPVIVRLLLAADLGDRPVETALANPAAADAITQYVCRMIDIQPPVVVEAMEWATVVDPIHEDLLADLFWPAGADGGVPLLAGLGDIVVLPITGSDGGWYRLQPVMREELERRLVARVGPHGIRAARRRAATWYAAHGLTTEAVGQALAADDLEHAIELVVRAGFDRVSRHVTGEVGRWLAMLPADVVADRADLLILKALDDGRRFAAISCASTAREARRLLLDDGARASASEPSARLLPLTEVIELDASPGPETADALLTLYHRLMPTIDPVDQMARGVLATATAIRLTRLAGVVAGQTLLEERRGGIGADDVAEQAYNAAALGLLQDFDVASASTLRETLERSRQLAELLGIHGLHSFAATRLGWEWLRLLDVSAADALFTQSAALPEISGLVSWREERQGAAMVRLLMGDERSAHAIAASTVATIERVGLHSLLENARSFQARLWLAAMDFPRVDQWVESELLDPEREHASLPESTILTRVRALLAQREAMADGSPLDAEIESSISLLEREAEGTGLQRTRLVASMCRGLFEHARGQDCTTSFAEAVRIASARDDLLIFAENGQHMADLLLAIRIDLPDEAFVTRAIAASERFGALFPHRPATRKLTNREFDVLIALQGRSDRREIANRLNISDRTVQRHTVNLYRKFGVSNRADAVRRGIAFGWLKADG